MFFKKKILILQKNNIKYNIYSKKDVVTIIIIDVFLQYFQYIYIYISNLSMSYECCSLLHFHSAFINALHISIDLYPGIDVLLLIINKYGQSVPLSSISS